MSSFDNFVQYLGGRVDQYGANLATIAEKQKENKEIKSEIGESKLHAVEGMFFRATYSIAPRCTVNNSQKMADALELLKTFERKSSASGYLGLIKDTIKLIEDENGAYEKTTEVHTLRCNARNNAS